MVFRAMVTALACGIAAQVSAAQDAAVIPDKVGETTRDLIDTALADPRGLQFVEDLTTEIGPRLAGSPAEARARTWSAAELSRLGFQNVRIETFTIPYWSRRIERAHLAGERPQPLVITALGGSPATPEGGTEAGIVRYTSLAELATADPADISGRIVFLDEMMTRTMDGSGYGYAVRKRSQCGTMAADKGAEACLIRSVGTQPRRFPHTGMMAREAVTGALPSAALSPPDADQLARLLQRGPVRVHLELQVETATGAPSGNVIGEIVGRERPDEIVLIGCHLDSWDLGTGALDDAAGCGIVVGAALAIAELPEPPRRTIRVVLYGAEEIGLFGGDAYARRHSADLEKHVFASESDFGAGPVWRLETRFGEGALTYARAMQAALAPLGVLAGNNTASGGPDIGVLRRAGVPVVTPRQDGTDYFDYHHTPDDTFDKIVPEQFQQNVAVYAAMTYLAAESGWDFRKAAEASPAEVGTR